MQDLKTLGFRFKSVTMKSNIPFLLLVLPSNTLIFGNPVSCHASDSQARSQQFAARISGDRWLHCSTIYHGKHTKEAAMNEFVHLSDTIHSLLKFFIFRPTGSYIHTSSMTSPSSKHPNVWNFDKSSHSRKTPALPQKDLTYI